MYTNHAIYARQQIANQNAMQLQTQRGKRVKKIAALMFKKRFAVAVSLTSLLTCGYAAAADITLNYDQEAKYFEPTDMTPSYLFSRALVEGRYSMNLITVATIPEALIAEGLKTVCVRILEDVSPGLFSSELNANVYFVPVSKVQSVKTLGNAGSKKTERGLLQYDLTDGTTIKAVASDITGVVVACGLHQETGKFTARNVLFSVYDHTKMVQGGNVISDTYNLDSPRKIVVGYTPYRAGFAGGVTTLTHEQAALQDEVANRKAKIQAASDARIAQRQVAEAYAAQRAAAQAEAAREARLREQAIQTAKVREAEAMRANIKIGSQTNCGKVFDVRKPMIGVQTMYGMQYLDISTLWGPSANCHFVNGNYIGPNPR